MYVCVATYTPVLTRVHTFVILSIKSTMLKILYKTHQSQTPLHYVRDKGLGGFTLVSRSQPLPL